MTTMERFTCRQLGTLAATLDYRERECRRLEADLAGLRGMPYTHAAVVAGRLPVQGEDDGEG